MCVSSCVHKSVRVCMQVCRAPRCMHSSCVTEHIMMNNSPKWLIVSCHCHKSHTHCPLQPPPNTQNTHAHKLRPKKPHTNRTFVASYIPTPSPPLSIPPFTHIYTRTHVHTLSHRPTIFCLTCSASKVQPQGSAFDRGKSDMRTPIAESTSTLFPVYPCVPLCSHTREDNNVCVCVYVCVSIILLSATYQCVCPSCDSRRRRSMGLFLWGPCLR